MLVDQLSGRASASEAEGLGVVLPTQLPNPDWVFDAPQFADITFRRTAVDRSSKTPSTVTCDLTLHGVTTSIPIVLAHIGPKTTRRGTRSGFTANFTIKRSDFGMGFMLGALGDDVTLMIGIEGIKKK